MQITKHNEFLQLEPLYNTNKFSDFYYRVATLYIKKYKQV